MIAEGLNRGRQVRGQSLTTIEQAHYRCSSKLSRRVMAHKRDKHKYQQSIKTRERENDTFPTRYCTIKQATRRAESGKKANEADKHTQTDTKQTSTHKRNEQRQTKAHKQKQTAEREERRILGQLNRRLLHSLGRNKKNKKTKKKRTHRHATRQIRLEK